MQPLGPSKVPEVVLAQIAESHPGGQVRLDESPGRIGHEHLAAVRRGPDARGTMHVQPDVVVPTERGQAGVDADPDGDTGPAPARPRP